MGEGLFEQLFQSSIERLMPVRTVFEITYRCNLQCPFCYRVEKPFRELGTDEAKAVIDDLKAEGCAFLTLTGGEPLNRPDFWDIAAFARDRSLALEIKTNGCLVDTDAADRIAGLLPLNVDISLYAAKAGVHDRMTMVDGSFDRAVEAIRLLVERGVRVTVKSLLTRDNFDEHRGIRRLADSLGADAVFDVTVTGSQDGLFDPTEHRLTDAQLSEFASRYAEDYAGLLGGQPATAAMGSCAACLAGVSTCCISPYGDIYPCVQFTRSVGNIRKLGFRQIWRESRELQALRAISLDDLSSCRACDVQEYCMRCPALAALEDGDLLGPSKEACRLARVFGKTLIERKLADQDLSKRESV